MERKQKKVKGITLIALVVTIVVLLILAGASISMLTGDNGIMKQATDAKEKNKESEVRERVLLEVAGSYDSYGNMNIDLLNKNLQNIEGLTHSKKTLTENPIIELPDEVELDGYKIKIEEDKSVTVSGTISGKDEVDEFATPGVKYETETTITVGKTTVTIPAGATVSGIEEETNVNEGLVIYMIPEGTTIDWNDPVAVETARKNYDQFVWIPVPYAFAVDENNDRRD